MANDVGTGAECGTAHGEGRMLGGWRLVRRLGVGGMGSVYEAVHASLGVRRAVKVFADAPRNADALKARFLAEGRTLANLSHPRVVRIYDFAIDVADGSPYFVMDLVLSPDGEHSTLEDARLRGIDEKQAAAWFADMCEGLDYIHAQGVVHGDVKLENVLVGSDGCAVISDFGISRAFGEELRQKVESGPCTETDALRMGTLNYLAPELLSDRDAQMQPGTDAWALGVMMFRMLTGFWFEDDNRERCLALLDGFDLPWKGVIDRLCSRDASARLSGGRLMPFAEKIVRRRATRSRMLCVAAACAALFALAVVAFCTLPPPSHKLPSGRDVRLCPHSPAWREFSRRMDYAMRTVLLVPFEGMDGEVEDALRAFMERRSSFFCHEDYWPQDRVGRIDALVSAQMPEAGAPLRASSPQLLALAGEVYRQKRLWSFGRGEFPEDVDRIVALAKRLVSDVSLGRYEPEWAFELVEAAVPFGRLDGRRIGANDSQFRSMADPWLAKMIEASAMAAEASRAHGSAFTPRDDLEHDEKCALAARLFKEALSLHPERYRAAERLIGLSHADLDEARLSFERCQTYCFDDLRAWKSYAGVLARHDGDPARARLARLLDQALASGRYDSWVPAFYVIGRWLLLARYDEHGRTLDDRSWAYADEEVRRKTVETIRRYKDSALMSEAPGPRRLSLTALFAAAALTCGDESLAAELARRIPSALFNAVAGSVMRTTSQTFRRLKNLAEDDGNGPESFPSAHDSPHNNQQ